MSAFPTHLLEPSTLAAEARGARRARRRRSLAAVVIVVLVVAPPIALTWLARGTAPADGTLTYPSRWSGSGVGLQDSVEAGTAAPGSKSCIHGPAKGDVVTKVNGGAVEALGVAERADLDQSIRTYTVLRDGSSCDVAVPIGQYPWANLIRSHALVLPVVVVMWVVATFVFLRKPRDPAARALFGAAVVLPYTGMVFPFGTQVVDLLNGYRLWPHIIGDLAYVFLWGTMLHFALAFPRRVPLLRRRHAVVVAYLVPFAPWVAYVGVRHLADTVSGADPTVLERLSYLAAISMPASLLGPPLLAAAALWQYRHAENEPQRKRMRWIIYALLAAAAGYLVLYPISDALGARPIARDWVAVLFLVVPLVLGAAVLQYGLFDLQVLLSRSLIYGTLTFLLIIIPGGLALWVSTSAGNQPWQLTDPRVLNAVLATALATALFFQALRSRLKRVVSHLVFGSRDDPYEVASQLIRDFQPSRAGGALLNSIAETVSRTLRLPYVCIELPGPEGAIDAYSSGEPRGPVQAIPLRHDGEEIGRLLLGSGYRTEPFGPEDQKLVELLAHQVGLAAMNQLLATRLQRSLERAVSVREEERRRLRRDIHDGLGPMLTASRMRLEVAGQLLSTDPAEAAGILHDLTSTQQQLIDDVRRLVDGLRPPVLDQFGLVVAIKQRAAAFAAQSQQLGGLDITVDAASDIEPLPAAVEVAGYRIVLEALTNVSRHAQASTCQVRLRKTTSLVLEIQDDGRGLPEPYRAGVGLSSMRERAIEVGGVCAITSSPATGTLVAADLPIHPPPPQS